MCVRSPLAKQSDMILFLFKLSLAMDINCHALFGYVPIAMQEGQRLGKFERSENQTKG